MCDLTQRYNEVKIQYLICNREAQSPLKSKPGLQLEGP